MQIDASPLANALHQLETSINYFHSDLAKDPNLRLQFRNSSIQCFEFTYELSYKLIRRQLEQIISTIHAVYISLPCSVDTARPIAYLNTIP